MNQSEVDCVPRGSSGVHKRAKSVLPGGRSPRLDQDNE